MTDWEKTARELGGMLKSCIELLKDCINEMPDSPLKERVLDVGAHFVFCLSGAIPEPMLMRHMTEPELSGHITNQLRFVKRCQTPDTIGSMLIIFQDDGIVQYGATIDPETSPAALRELADRIENRETVKRGLGDNPQEIVLTSKPYTVLLLRPDYIADNFGSDTYLAYVEAEDVSSAVMIARQSVVSIDGTMPENTEDYYVLMVCDGHVNDIRPPVTA